MQSVKYDTYLGDILSSDGSNKPNIDNRVSRGFGKIAEIMGILSKLSLGKHYFRIALLLRESLFVSSLLFNAEVWYGLSSSDIYELDKLDRNLLKRICGLPNSAPTAALYLELGVVRLSSIIKARRVNYLHYLVRLPKHEMLSRFFWCQWFAMKQYDWCTYVRQDLVDLELPTGISEIESFSTFRWKSRVKRKLKEFEFKELLKIKDTKSKSKMSMLFYCEFKIQDYFTTLEVKIAKTVLRYRIKMSKYSDNFKGSGSVDVCPLCKTHEDKQDLAFSCPVVMQAMSIQRDYMELFSSVVDHSLAETLQSIEDLRKNVVP